jgi:hypothetical protein
MYDQLTTTLYSKTAQLNPAVLDIINRTRVVGLHKVAAHITNRDEFTLRDAIQELGTKLAYEHLKNQKIASGLGSLRELHNADIVKLSNLGRMFGKGTAETWQNLMPRAMRKPAPGASVMPPHLSGGGTVGPLPKNTAPTVAERVPMGRLPTAPPATPTPGVNPFGRPLPR